jgi:PAS domain S-box-containing protein
MKFRNNSIRFRIVTPIFGLIVVTMLSLLCIVHNLSQHVLEDYRSFVLSRHSSEVLKILDTAITELTTAQFLDKDVVVDTKKKEAVDGIVSYLADNNLDGWITAADGNKIIYSSLDSDFTGMARLFISKKGHFHIDKGMEHTDVYSADFPAWNWRFVVALKPKNRFEYLYKGEVALLLPLMGVSFISVLAGVLLILKKNLDKPVGRIISDIRRGQEIKQTGIYELDTVGSVINDTFNRLSRKTEQYQTLHDTAVSLHENFSIDEFLNQIIGNASRLIKAELAVIALYDDKGRFKKIVTHGTEVKAPDALPDGKGILEVMHLVLAPMRIDNVPEHPVFGGCFPAGSPLIKNLLAYPVFSGEKKIIGVFYFGNKQGGFTEEDEDTLKAISADLSVALNKTEKLMQMMRFRQIIDSAFDVILTTDANGYITYVNRAFETVTGYSAKEVTGKKMNMLKSGCHDEVFYRDLWTTIKSGNVWRGEFINRKKDGEIYYASEVISPVCTDGDVNYVAIQRDITQEKRLYEQLLRAQKMEAIGTLAGGIAHDFNNLLTAILGYSEMMVSEMNEGEKYYRPLVVIKNAAEKGAELAKSILTVSRKVRLELKPVCLNSVVNNTMDLLARSIPKNIEIRLNLDEALPPISADPTQMQQVVINLAVNARDAMPDGGILHIGTSLAGKENGIAVNGAYGYVKLSISDTGKGMDSETQRRIFDPFFTTKEGEKGTGIGLYIAHSIVTNHGGCINLYSEPWKGTRFNIYFPAIKGVVEEKSGVQEDISGSGTILVIDDEESIRDLTTDILEPLGYTVLAAGDGEDGIRLFRQRMNDIDIVILDMIMPKMGGREVFQALKTIKPDVKVLLWSGYSHEGFSAIDELLKTDAMGFVQKPFTKQTIALAIRKALSDDRA